MRHRTAAAALCSFLTLLSCQATHEHAGPQAIVADANSAIVILPDLPLWSMSAGALNQTGKTIPIGEKLAIIGPPQTAPQGGKEREFQHVRRQSGSEGWVRSDYVVARAILAVVTTDDAVIYSSEANSAATTESIPRMTVVAIHSETGGMPFIQVSGYDPVSRTMLRHVILRNEGVSANPSDVQAAILLQLAASSQSPKQQKAFLTSAIKDYPGSIFAPELNAALDALTSPPKPAPAAAPAPAAPPAPVAPAVPGPGAAPVQGAAPAQAPAQGAAPAEGAAPAPATGPTAAGASSAPPASSQ
jgi:hypothetical protein